MGHLIANIIEWTLKLLNRGGDKIARGSEKLINNADQLAGGTIRASRSGIQLFGLHNENGPLIIAWIFATIIIAIIIYILITLVERKSLLSVILPVTWIFASINFGINLDKKYFQSAKYRNEIFKDIMAEKGSIDFKSIKYIDDSELILRHNYVSSCFLSLLKNYDSSEKYKKTYTILLSNFVSLDNINRFLDQKLVIIKNDLANDDLAKDDLEFFDMMMGQRTLAACRSIDKFLYSEKY